jgi:hypothetical protein
LLGSEVVEFLAEAANFGLLTDEHGEDDWPLRVIDAGELGVAGVRALFGALNEAVPVLLLISGQ